MMPDEIDYVISVGVRTEIRDPIRIMVYSKVATVVADEITEVLYRVMQSKIVVPYFYRGLTEMVKDSRSK